MKKICIYFKRLYELYTAQNINRRLNRVQYTKIHVCFALFMFLEYLLIVILPPIVKDFPLYNKIINTLTTISISLFIMAFLWILRAVSSRLHDFNCTGWLTLPVFFLLHPVLYFIMFVPGTQGNNKYGEPSTGILNNAS